MRKSVLLFWFLFLFACHASGVFAEDNLENRMLLTQLLPSVGFDVREATNGQEAIEQYEHWQPHLILMDMRMPIMDGYAATRRVIGPLTADLFLSPRALSCRCGRGWIRAMLSMPSEISPSDIERNEPLVLHPCGVEARYQWVFRRRRRGHKRTYVVA